MMKSFVRSWVEGKRRGRRLQNNKCTSPLVFTISEAFLSEQISMRAIQLLLGLLPILCGDVGAAPADQDPEQAASLRINELQKQYQQYVRSAIKDRASGCTTENIMYRQEW